MDTLQSLKSDLRAKAAAKPSSTKRRLSDTEYSAGFDIFVTGPGWTTYEEFIIPQLSRLLGPLLTSRFRVSVLEIGPGPKSVLGYLPRHLRWKIRRYCAFEPNDVFATRLEEWLHSTSERESPLPCLEGRPDIYRIPFGLDSKTRDETNTCTSDDAGKFDVILFCHSMYGMEPKHSFIENALGILASQAGGGMVVVIHRDGCLHLDNLMYHQITSFPAGVIHVEDNDEALDSFAPFVAGFAMQDADVNKIIGVEWREVCRTLGRRGEAHPDYLSFGSPEVMVAFTQHTLAVRELAAQVPLVKGNKMVKNREARLHLPALIARPTEVQHVQQCVRWAMKHRASLTVVGGGHSGHCLWPNVVSVDMSAFDQVDIITTGENIEKVDFDCDSIVVAETGCTTGSIIRKTMAAGVTVPLGARPSVGAGLWLQGGIGHLARLYGLACDAVIGAVVVSVASGQVLCVGRVPSQHQPAGSVRPENEADLLWGLKGAGTNFSIVVSVTFKAYPAPSYSIRNRVIALSDDAEARLRLADFDKFVAGVLPRKCSADAYLYWDADQLHLGMTMLESSVPSPTFEITTPMSKGRLSGSGTDSEIVDGVGLFGTEMYISRMHGGHGGGKTSSFKRCLFLSHIREMSISEILVSAIQNRPSPLCYLHLLHGGGAIRDVATDATAFGCRDWDFACVITGVWSRDQDGTELSRAAVQWVYGVAGELLPLSSGAYGADLGPDPRDATLAARAFGSNSSRLARLKHISDPRNVLAYTCPLPKMPEQKLIVLVTGESCVGKDYCADIWSSVFTTYICSSLTARIVSISDATKREYATATGADLNRLLLDRAYKEHHRSALTTFFYDQVQQRPQLLEDTFLHVVYGATDVDVLLITGMRDEAPVAALSHLAPNSKLLDVHIRASREIRLVRRGCHTGNDNSDDSYNKDNEDSLSNLAALDYRPCFTFDNDVLGNEAAERFAKHHLLPFFHKDLQRLANMVCRVPDFPRPGIDFRHVLDIAQHPGGLTLCASLLQSHFTGDWSKVCAVVCCEAGGFVYASPLATRVNLPLVLIRDAGKLPPPTISTIRCPSHISSSVPGYPKEKGIEMSRDVIPRGSSVVVVDDVFATGETLCAILQLLGRAGVDARNTSVIAVAEFPIHRGRELLHQRGFGGVNVQSLLVFGGL